MSAAARMPEALQTALSAVFPGAVFPNVYTGPLLRYVVWNYDELPRVFADSAPHASIYLVQVHLYLPHKESPTEAIQAIRRALWDARFTWPSLVDSSDSDGQHWVLECQYTDGGGFYNSVSVSDAESEEAQSDGES